MGRKRDPNKPKKTFWDRYKHYDTSQGFGNPEEWKSAFRARVGVGGQFSAASGGTSTKKHKSTTSKRKKKVEGKVVEEVVEFSYTARGILHLPDTCNDWDIIKSAYRVRVRETHPDVGGDPEEFMEVQESYEILKEEFGVK